MRRAGGWRIGESIPPAGQQALERLGLWHDFRAQGHLASVGSCASWGKPELGYNDFLLDAQGQGWHLDRAAFEDMLAAAVSARGGEFARGLRLRDVERNDGGGYLLACEGEGGRRIVVQAGFLVDATGIAAGAVRKLKVARNQVDCLAVLSAAYDLAEPDGVPTQALLEACDYGWWYAAKLPKNRLIVALAVEPTEQRRFGDAGVWRAHLAATSHVARWLSRGRAASAGGAKLAPALAPSAILSRVTNERWLAVGDAASAYDPVTAQGIVKALGDGEAAGEAIAAFLNGGGEAPLLAYQDGVFARFRDYLRLRHALYARERRWPQAPFWRNRLPAG
jgi:flavin-dependent dehydrogenase